MDEEPTLDILTDEMVAEPGSRAWNEWLLAYQGEFLYTLIALVAAVAIAWLLQKRFLPPVALDRTRRHRRRIVRGCLLLLLLGALLPIWEQLPVGGEIYRRLVAYRLYWPLLGTVILALAAYVTALMMQDRLLTNITELDARHRMRSMVRWAGLGAFLVALALLWGSWVGMGNLGTFLGLLGAGLALSLQETLLCIAGWALIMIQKIYDIGDRIELAGHKGDVIDISLMQTSLLEVGGWVYGEQSTGRIIHIPNSQVYRSQAINYTRGFPFVWNEIQTTVTFESDWEAAKAILLEQATEETAKIEDEMRRLISQMQRNFAIHYQHFTPIVYTSIAAHGVNLTLRYLVPARKRRSSAHEICEDVIREFRDHPRVDFAYPTTRFYDNPSEGKPALTPPAGGKPPKTE